MKRSVFEVICPETLFSADVVTRLRRVMLFLTTLVVLTPCPAKADLVVATWTGGTGDYHSAENWNIGTVPVNNETTTYKVVIPGGKTVNLSVAGEFSIAEFSLAADSTFDVGSDSILTVANEASVGGKVLSGGGRFTATQPNAVHLTGNKAQAEVTSGGTLEIAGSDYSSTGLFTQPGGWNVALTHDLFASQGSGSLLDLSSLESINAGFNDGQYHNQNIQRIRAWGGGRIDLSGLKSITAPHYADTHGGYEDRLDIIIAEGGEIDLSGLSTLTSAGNGVTRFDVRDAMMELPSLESGHRVWFDMDHINGSGHVSLEKVLSLSHATVDFGVGSTFAAPLLETWNGGAINMAPGTSLDLPALTSLANIRVSLPGENTFSAPDLARMTNVAWSLESTGDIVVPHLVEFSGRSSSVVISPTRTFSTGGLVDIDNAQFHVRDTATWGVATGDILAENYSSTDLFTQPGGWNAALTHDLFTSQGLESLLDLSSIESINAGFNDGQYHNQNIQRIIASAGGRIDLSGVKAITAPHYADTHSGYEDRLDIIIAEGGEIDLSGLRTLTSAGNGVTRFDVRDAMIELPSLESGHRVWFDLNHDSGSGSISLDNVVSLDQATVDFGVGAIVTAPLLETWNGGAINMAPGTSLDLPALTSLANIRVSLPGENTFSAPDLARMTNVAFSQESTGDIDVPNLVEFSGRSSSVVISPTRTFSTGGLVDIDNAQFHVRDSATWGVDTGDILAENYSSTGLFTQPGGWNAALTHDLFASQGAGSLLDLSSLESINAGFNDGQYHNQNIQRIIASAGGKIDLSGVRSITAPHYADTHSGYEDRLDIIIAEGGEIDLSGLRTLTSAGNGVTRFDVRDAMIELPSLESGHRVWFDMDHINGSGHVSLEKVLSLSHATVDFGVGATFAAPLLETWNGGAINMAPDTSLDLPSLTGLANVTIQMQPGSSFKASDLSQLDGTVIHGAATASIDLPNVVSIDGGTISSGASCEVHLGKLVSLTNSYLNLDGTSTAVLGPLHDISGSRLAVRNGAVLDLANQVSYSAAAADDRSHRALLLANGEESLIDLSEVVTFDGARWGRGGAWQYSVVATNGGIIDLSSVMTIRGPTASQGDGDDLLCFTANSGGEIHFGEAVRVTGRTRFSLGSGGALHVKDLAAVDHGEFFLNDMSTILDVEQNLYLAPGSQLIAAPLSQINIGKSLILGTATQSHVDLDQAIVHLDGGGMRYLEVAGEDIGIPDEGQVSGNFGIGRLIVGSPDESTTVELVDVFDNGNRSGGQEAVYLYGLGSNLDGLLLHEGSTLVTDHLNAYAWMDGDWVHLNDWLQDGMTPSTVTLGGFSMQFDPVAQSMTNMGRVPEPGTLTFLAIGLVALLVRRGRRG